MKRAALPLLLTMTVSACAQAVAPAAPAPAPAPAPPVPPLAAPGGECNASLAQFAVGQTYTTQLAEEAGRRAGATVVRAIRPGQMVTMEFSPHRLNLRLDAADRVQQATCG